MSGSGGVKAGQKPSLRSAWFSRSVSGSDGRLRLTNSQTGQLGQSGVLCPVLAGLRLTNSQMAFG